jgi:hypothetical protein
VECSVVQPSIVVEAGAATDSDAGAVCLYASVAGLGCKSQTPSQELSKCSERGCNTLLHRTCFAHHFPSQVEGVFVYSKRHCPQHAATGRALNFYSSVNCEYTQCTPLGNFFSRVLVAQKIRN